MVILKGLTLIFDNYDEKSLGELYRMGMISKVE